MTASARGYNFWTMTDFGKLLILLGLAVAVIGVVVWGFGKAGFQGLPGDIRYQGDHVRFYFPIVSCILLSVVATLALWLWRWLSGR